jgi:hypothetical protein
MAMRAATIKGRETDLNPPKVTGEPEAKISALNCSTPPARKQHGGPYIKKTNSSPIFVSVVASHPGRIHRRGDLKILLIIGLSSPYVFVSILGLSRKGGQNGAGKSALIRVVTGLAFPTEGTSEPDFARHPRQILRPVASSKCLSCSSG